MVDEIQQIAVIGTGNVAYHLVRAFHESGLEVVQVVSRGEASKRRFSKSFPWALVSTAPALLAEADLYILTVNDDNILEAARALNIKDQFVVHTSGSVPLQVLDGILPNTGVFYPLQTLTYGGDTDFSKVPVCLEADTGKNLRKLETLAHRVTKTVVHLDSRQRMALHLAAVFASNFSFHVFDVAREMAMEQDIDPALLTPLIMETARKAVGSPPGKGQTGPAARKDWDVIRKHLDLLKDHKGYAELYQIITESIIARKDKHDEL